MTIDRRTFISSLTAGALAVACGSERDPVSPSLVLTDFNEPARLHLHPRAPTIVTTPGVSPIWYNTDWLTYLRVPPSYRPGHQMPLAIALHGGGGRGDFWMGSYGALTDAAGIVVIAPQSQALTWDAVQSGRFGADLTMINAVLDETFNRVDIDPSKIALIGFSDGASYALSLGLSNGDNIRHVVAHSPGSYIDVPRHGTPDFFMSHGTNDGVFFIEDTSEVIVPLIRGYGDSVNYVEFNGAHEIPPAIASQAVTWLASEFRK